MEEITITNGTETAQTTRFYWDRVGKKRMPDWHIVNKSKKAESAEKESSEQKPKEDVQLQKKASKAKKVKP